MSEVFLSGDSLVGRLLVSHPELTDPPFERAVILILDHHDEGAMGVMLNRPVDVAVDEILPGWGSVASAPAQVFHGGPVEPDSALAVAGVAGSEPVDRVERVLGGFGVIDLDADPEDVRQTITGMRIFVGYAGWGAGQLEQEIRQKSWFLLNSEARDPFTTEPEGMWSQVLRRQGGDLSLVASFPSDPRMN